MRAHVNLIDLIDVFGTGRLAKTFRKGKAAGEYTRRTGKYFPRDDKDAGDLLNFLLQRKWPEASDNLEPANGQATVVVLVEPASKKVQGPRQRRTDRRKN